MTVLVVGIGHLLRGDDAVGPLVADRIAVTTVAGVTAFAHHGEGTDLMERWAGFDHVILVDATHGDDPPGTIRRWDAVAHPLPAALFPKSSHQFGVAEAVDLARLLGRLPSALTVIGVAGRAFDPGCAMSPAVVAAVEQVVELVLRDCGAAAPLA